MNNEIPPPIPPPAPQLPAPTPTPLVNMAPRWIIWILACTVLAALPWMVYNNHSTEEEVLSFLTLFAMAAQLAASIVVAVGFCRRRALGVGGAIGMSIVFTIAAFAIGTACWFGACLVRAGAADFK